MTGTSTNYFRHIPNVITVFRIALVPLIIVLLVRGKFVEALLVFVVAGMSDMADGYIARRYCLSTRLGSILDPIADKLLIAAVAVSLAWAHIIPWWLAAAVLIRDVVILGGASTYFFRSGGCDMEPSFLGKLNTCIQVGFVLILLGHNARLIDVGAILPAALIVTAFFTVVSGIHYVVVWSKKGRELGLRLRGASAGGRKP